MTTTPICQSCHSAIRGGAQYCSECGSRIGGRAAEIVLPQITERKLVTIVFIDMVDSLGLIRDQDPEDAHEVLTSALGVMTEAVHAYGGMVVGSQGDGVMAIFGAPLAQDDHAARACYAALRVHSLVARTLAARIALRVGINSGEVAVGSALNDFANGYTATGAVVHIAARLQGIAPPNATVMSSQTAALVRDVMQTVPMKRSILKGLAAPIDIHRLLGPVGRGRRSPKGVRLAFVGRTSALVALDEALKAALDGRGRVVGVSGEAGIGKTALIERFAHRRRHSIRLIRSTAEHHTSVAPFQPFLEVVLQILGLENVAPPHRRIGIAVRLEALGLDPQVFEAPLLDLLDLDGLPRSWHGLSPRLRHDMIGAAVIQVLLAESQLRNLVIVLEDLQRADSATIELINRIVISIGQHPVLVIVAFRPELDQEWERSKNYEQLRLDRLSNDDIKSLIAGLLGKAVLPQVERRLVDWSKGNPLFLRESVQAMIEAKAVSDPEAVAQIAIPPSISAVIAARIDRLAPATKNVLIAASVLGEQFDAGTLAIMSGIAEAALLTKLEALETFGFVRPLQSVSRIYTFEHGLFQEVCYAMLVRRQRRDLHQAAFTALRQSNVNTSPVPVEELALHAYGGRLWTEAVSLCWEAGRRAAIRYSNREAALHLENATAALSRADPEQQRLGDAIALRLELRSVSIPLLRLDRIGTLLAEAHDMAGHLGDLSQRAKVTAFLAGHAYLTQNPTQCIPLCRGALRLAGRANDAKLHIAPRLYLAQAQYGLGQYRRVVATLERNVAFRDPTISGAAVGLPARPLIMCSCWLAMAQAELGRFSAAQALASEMLTLVDESQPFESLYVLTAQGFVLMLRGEIEAALESSASALLIADRNDIAFIIPVLASQVGFLLAAQGRAAEGLLMNKRALRKAEEIGVNAGRSRWCARLAETCLLTGDAAEARRQAETALKIAEDGAELGYLCSALRLRAKTMVLEANLNGAVRDLLRAMDVARNLQVGPALAKCHFDFGALAYRAGRLTEARGAFKAAAKGFSRYQMTYGTGRVTRAIAQLNAGVVAPGVAAFFGSAE